MEGPKVQSTEGPERGAGGAKRRSAEGVRSGEGLSIEGLGACPQKNFQKTNVEVAYFSEYFTNCNDLFCSLMTTTQSQTVC